MSLPEFISASGRKVPVELRRRKGTRHLRLSYTLENCIVVSKPWHCSERACLKFIEQNRDWVEGQISAAPEVVGVGEWFEQSPWLSAAGLRLRVAMQLSGSRRAYCQIDEEEAKIGIHMPHGADDEMLQKLVRKFAKEALSERATELAKRHGLKFGGLSVRNQSSRWGSCSSKRMISLNWRLILADPSLQDYVILHELAHLTEMNHSKRFWELLDTYDPNRRKHEADLAALTPEIMRVRAC